MCLKHLFWIKTVSYAAYMLRWYKLNTQTGKTLMVSKFLIIQNNGSFFRFKDCPVLFRSTEERLQQLRALLCLKRETNNDFILPSVYKALRVNPWWHIPWGEQYLCSTKGNVPADPERCCRPPPGLQEAQNKDNFHCLRQTGHTWVKRRPTEDNVSSVSGLLLSVSHLNSRSFIFKTTVNIPSQFRLSHFTNSWFIPAAPVRMWHTDTVLYHRLGSFIFVFCFLWFCKHSKKRIVSV